MIQVNENLIVLQPGDQYQDTYENYLKIYLSGSLDVGNSGIPWQQKFINGLEKMITPHPDKPGIPDYSNFKFIVVNPLAPTNGTPTIDNPEFLQKMQWKLGIMQNCDVIFCNFLKKSVELSAVEDYLLFAQSGKVICRCPMESVFYHKIKVISDTFQIPLLGDSDSVIQVMNSMFQFNQKFNELLNYNL